MDFKNHMIILLKDAIPKPSQEKGRDRSLKPSCPFSDFSFAFFCFEKEQPTSFDFKN